MDSFLVLGIIPGTNIQISFYGWLILAAVLLTLHGWKRKTGYQFPHYVYLKPLQKALLLASVYLAVRLGRLGYRASAF